MQNLQENHTTLKTTIDRCIVYDKVAPTKTLTLYL